MKLFTFILDFGGGTYVSQVMASSFEQAPASWARSLKESEVRGLGPASLRELVAVMKAESPSPLTGLSRVWCVTALLRGKLALINFTETATTSEAANHKFGFGGTSP